MRKTKVMLFSVALSVGTCSFIAAAQPALTQTVPLTPDMQGTPQAPDQSVPQANDQTAPQVPDATLQAVDPQAPAAPDAQADAPDAAPQQPKDPYDVTEFFSDAQRYGIGDVVPEKYRGKAYEIIEWQKRHLPAPDAGSHWTYMGGNYVLISDAQGKIIKAKSGEIFFH